MTDLNRRVFLCGAAAISVMPAVAENKAENKQEMHRFRTPDFDIEMTVKYHDGYGSSGFWFRQGNSRRQFCISAGGEESRHCLADFRGSLAIRSVQGAAAVPG